MYSTVHMIDRYKYHTYHRIISVTALRFGFEKEFGLLNTWFSHLAAEAAM